MTPRDEFACSAMMALYPLYAMRGAKFKMEMGSADDLSHTEGSSSIEGGEVNYDALANEAYLLADAMLRARDNNFKSELENVLKVRP
jgi:hypothetical protein